MFLNVRGVEGMRGAVFRSVERGDCSPAAIGKQAISARVVRTKWTTLSSQQMVGLTGVGIVARQAIEVGAGFLRLLAVAVPLGK